MQHIEQKEESVFEHIHNTIRNSVSIKLLSLYLLASATIVGMISMYAKSVLASSKLAFILFAFFSLIYSFVFLILQLEDFTLLVGSFGLVLVLGIYMYLPRKEDWYGLKPKQTITYA